MIDPSEGSYTYGLGKRIVDLGERVRFLELALKDVQEETIKQIKSLMTEIPAMVRKGLPKPSIVKLRKGDWP